MDLPDDSGRNKHMRSLCFLCRIAAKWGPCEHQYAGLLQEGLVDQSQLPKPRAKGRPSKKSTQNTVKRNQGSSLCPGPRVTINGVQTEQVGRSSVGLGGVEASAQSSEDRTLQSILRKAGCGFICLDIDVAQAAAIMDALQVG